jgi:hypothetical protein
MIVLPSQLSEICSCKPVLFATSSFKTSGAVEFMGAGTDGETRITALLKSGCFFDSFKHEVCKSMNERKKNNEKIRFIFELIINF